MDPELPLSPTIEQPPDPTRPIFRDLPRGKRLMALGGVAAWFLLMCAGMGWMWRHAGTPGAKHAAPEIWPAGSRALRAPGQPALVVFAHPRCPCSRATVGELALIMAKARGRVQAQVWFYRPGGMPEDWAHTDLWRSAADIPGVSVAGDEGGAEAACFHATVSGQTLLYSGAGRRLFNGGITSSRGHSGDNDGRAAVLALLHNDKLTEIETPVFGCALSGSAPTATR